tara:strand:+ start:3881 stop:4123 length:243 start_codon:yes stop_codon:yes gene_type:complete
MVNGEIVALTNAEIATITAERNSMKSEVARAKRNALLAASDAMGLADRITDDWRTYRQSLRDVPLQSGFPSSITWPSEPT